MHGTALAETAQRLADSAREHKRLSAYHRRQAQQDRRALEEMVAYFRANGINVVIQSKPGGTDE